MSQAYELGLGERNVFAIGGSPMSYEEFPTNQESQEIAPVIHLSEAMMRHVVQEEALDNLAEVVDLNIARRAVNEAYNLRPAPHTEAQPLPPTGTSNETMLAASPIVEAPQKPQLVGKQFVPTHEAVVKHEFVARGATPADIEALVDVDMQAFETVYKNYGMSREELRADLVEKFTGRFNMLGSDWIRLVEKDGVIAGFMTCCPTSKTPEDFQSWEKTTDNGTLETTFDPDGENVYIVSLSMLPGVGEAARNMLFAHQIGKMIEGGYQRAFFESRLPGLGAWVRRECRETGRDFDSLDKEEQFELAEQYFNTTKSVNGKEVPIDRLIRIYSQAGCKFTRIVPDAYDDAPSMNFGAVGIYENPLPKGLRNNRIASKIVGKTVQILSKSHWLMQKAF